MKLLIEKTHCPFPCPGCSFITDHALAQKPEGMVDTKFNRMFAKNCCGITGADGEYSVLLPDGRTVWIFGDSFFGTVNPDRSREKTIPWFIRNSMAVQEADTLRSIYHVINGWDTSLVVPPGATKGKQFSEDSLWYWPGDGFIENGKLKVFMSGFYQATAGRLGIRMDQREHRHLLSSGYQAGEDRSLSLPGKIEVHWGHAVCDGDEKHTYIYGAEDKTKNLYVARAPKGNILAPWEFWTGTNGSAIRNFQSPCSPYRDRSSSVFSS